MNYAEERGPSRRKLEKDRIINIVKDKKVTKRSFSENHPSYLNFNNLLIDILFYNG